MKVQRIEIVAIDLLRDIEATAPDLFAKLHKDVIVFYTKSNMVISPTSIDTALTIWLFYNINNICCFNSISYKTKPVSFLG